MIFPAFHSQGPTGNCVLRNPDTGAMVDLSWFNCTAQATATAIEASTGGHLKIPGCQVRQETNDFVGGTTLPQNVAVAAVHGVKADLFVGANAVHPSFPLLSLATGQPVVLQGNASAMLGTRFQSTSGPVNHAICLIAVRGGTLNLPGEVLVYDPARKSAAWWPTELVLKFAAELRPYGDADLRQLGRGRWYCAVFPKFVPPVPAPIPYAPDVPAALKALDPTGRSMGAAILRTGSNFGHVINVIDFEVACNKAGIKYKTLGYDKGGRALLAWRPKK